MGHANQPAVHPSVRPLTPVLRDAMSLRSGRILTKLATTCCHISRETKKVVYLLLVVHATAAGAERYCVQ